MQFKEKFIAFVDILGFKQMVQAAENGSGMTLLELIDMLKDLGVQDDRRQYEKNGPIMCPQSQYIQRDLDFKLNQVSDCVVVSSEVSPAGVINLTNHCWKAVIMLLHKGIMCRGYITKGLIYHDDSLFIGTGYQEAYLQEANVSAFKREADERGTPFVEVDQAVCEYVAEHGDSCVKEMFSRMVKTDGTVTALFPFQRLCHSFVINGWFGHKFDPLKEKASNDNVRKSIIKVKERILAFIDNNNPRAVRKAEYYVEALNAQLIECDETDKAIDMLCAPFPSRRAF